MQKKKKKVFHCLLKTVQIYVSKRNKNATDTIFTNTGQKHHQLCTAPQSFSDFLGHVDPLHLKAKPLPPDHTLFNWNQLNNHFNHKDCFPYQKPLPSLLFTTQQGSHQSIQMIPKLEMTSQPHLTLSPLDMVQYDEMGILPMLLKHYERLLETMLGSFQEGTWAHTLAP